MFLASRLTDLEISRKAEYYRGVLKFFLFFNYKMINYPINY